MVGRLQQKRAPAPTTTRSTARSAWRRHVCAQPGVTTRALTAQPAARHTADKHVHTGERAVVSCSSTRPLSGRCFSHAAQVMRLLVPAGRGCQAGNGSLIPSTTSARAPCAYCDTLLPKKRQCIVYSFGVDRYNALLDGRLEAVAVAHPNLELFSSREFAAAEWVAGRVGGCARIRPWSGGSGSGK